MNEKKVPLRLVPRRTRAMIRLVFALVWCGFAFGSFASAFRAPAERTSSEGSSFFGFIFLLVGGVILVRAILLALPNSPLQYLQIDERTLKRRHFITVQQVAWEEIEWISVVQRWQGNGRGRTRHWWVLAENAESPFHEDVTRRIDSTAWAYDANAFKPLVGGGDETAAQLVDLLRECLGKARAGGTISILTLPPLLQNLAVEMPSQVGAGSQQNRDGDKRSRRTVER